jgi:hypothetical protein
MPRRTLAARHRRANTTLLLALLAWAGCAGGPALEQAIRARGGPVSAIVRESEATVTLGFPGLWNWRMVFAPPDRYAWTIYTTGAPLHHLYDGRVARSYVGSALSAEDASADAPLRSHARFMAVMNLDGLDAPGVQVRELDRQARPAGDAARGLEIVFADGERFTIGLDARARVVSVEGHVALPPFGRPLVRAALGDWRPVDGRRVAHHVLWTLDGQPLADERVVRACVPAGAAPAAAFAAPDTLPACP